MIIVLVVISGCSIPSPRELNSSRLYSMEAAGASELYTGDVARVKKVVSKGADLERVLKCSTNCGKNEVLYETALGLSMRIYTSNKSLIPYNSDYKSEVQKNKQILQYLLDNGADADNPEVLATLALYKKFEIGEIGELLTMIEPYQDGISGNPSKQKVLLAKQESNELEEVRLELENIKQSIRLSDTTNQSVVTNTDIGGSSNQPRIALVIANIPIAH